MDVTGSTQVSLGQWLVTVGQDMLKHVTNLDTCNKLPISDATKSTIRQQFHQAMSQSLEILDDLCSNLDIIVRSGPSAEHSGLIFCRGQFFEMRDLIEASNKFLDELSSQIMNNPAYAFVEQAGKDTFARCVETLESCRSLLLKSDGVMLLLPSPLADRLR